MAFDMTYVYVALSINVALWLLSGLQHAGVPSGDGRLTYGERAEHEQAGKKYRVRRHY